VGGSGKKQKKKVLVLSIHDYAGSGHRYSEAVNRVGRYESKSLKFLYHSFGYEVDYCIAENYAQKLDRPTFKSRMIKAQQMVDDADILHFKGDYPIMKRWGLFDKKKLRGGFPTLSIPVHKPIVITTSGSRFRRHLSNKGGLSSGLFPMETMMRFTNARTVTTPDLNYPEFDAEWLPFPLDTRKYDNLWLKADHSTVTLGHAPSIRAKKGTDSILIPAVNIIKSKGIDVCLNIIEGRSYEDSLREKRQFSIFWDQCGFGFYGNALVEACQYGIPSLAWMSDHSLNQMEKADRERLVVQTFKKTPESCADAIINMIESDMNELSIRTKKWVDDTHSYESVGAKLSAIYDKIL
jgi:hypothetical protein